MKDALYWFVYRLADIHEWIMRLNDGMEPGFTDKQLHFLVIGIAGMMLYTLVHPVVRRLARRGLEWVISLFYTLTVVIVITFGIEVGQQVTSTGKMEFADIVYGVAGFLAAFLVYRVVLTLVRGIVCLFSK